MFHDNTDASGVHWHSAALSVLARAQGAGLKALAETLLDDAGDIRVIQNRSGLVMLPMRDTVKHVDFHLGEVLMSEAHIEDADGHQGYGMIAGRDLERAMAMAVVDLALSARRNVAAIEEFIERERAQQNAADADVMRRVEATRVEMETF